MNITNLTLENFLSFEKLDLDITGVNVIQGINKDDDGQETNGTGKSAIQSGIEYALFATTSRGIPIKELIRWGAKKSYVSLTIYCPVRKEELLIERGIGRGSKLNLNVNSFPLDFANVNDGNKQIIEWLGISKEDIQNYYIINKEKYESFYTSSNKKKLEMIGRFSNLDILDNSDEVVQEEVNLIESNITKLGYKIGLANGRIEKSKELILKEENIDHDKKYEEEINRIDNSINNKLLCIRGSNDSIFTTKKQIVIKGKELIELDKEIKDLINEKDSIKVPDITKQLASFNSKLKTMNDEIHDYRNYIKLRNDDISDLRKQKSEASVNISGSVICPDCSLEFNPRKKGVNIKEEKEFIKDCKDVLVNLSNLVAEKQAQFNSFANEIDSVEKDKGAMLKKITDAGAEVNTLESKIFKVEKYWRLVSAAIEKFNNLIINNEIDIVDDEKAIELLKENKLEVKKGSKRQVYIGSLMNDINVDEKLIEEINEEIKVTESSMYGMQQWKYNFKMFKSNLSMDVLNVITSFTNKMLIDLGSDLQVKWEGFKVKTNGDLSDKITPLIIRDGTPHNFGSYSGGEKGRLEYANILANQYLINSTHRYGGLNFLSTDEITEGIDGLGLRDLAKALELTNKTILLTTHIVNESSSNILTVLKQGGKSVILD